MADCIFCMIRDGQIPSRKVYEDEHVFAILDNSQVTPGHTLLIPKKHVRNIFDYDDGDFLFRNGDTAFDSDGNMMMRMSDNMAMDMDSGELHLTSSWDDDDE